MADNLTGSDVAAVEQPGPLPGLTIVLAATAAMGALAGLLTLPPLGGALAAVLFVGAGIVAVVVGDRWSRRRPPRSTPLWHSPPAATFHLALVGPAVGLLCAVSVPTGAFLPLLVAWAALVVGAVLWAARAVSYLVACARRTGHGTPLWLLVAPLAGVAVGALLVVDAPLRARWMASRAAFDAAVESGDLDEGRLGWFEIESVSRDGEAIMFRETNTGVFTTGGFAYLPDGRRPPTPSSDEWSEYRHLGGPWYVWTSGW